MKVFIETPRLILRDWKDSDQEPYVQLNMDKDVMEFFPSVQTREKTLAQIERITANIAKDGYGFFAAERKDNNQFIGFVGLSHPGFESHFTPLCRDRLALKQSQLGPGFRHRKPPKPACNSGFEQLSLSEIYSFTAVHNLRSEQVMKKIGMAHAGFFEHH